LYPGFFRLLSSPVFFSAVTVGLVIHRKKYLAYQNLQLKPKKKPAGPNSAGK